MIDGLRPYPEMKASGLPWLGEVPKHWNVLRCKYVFREVDSRSETGAETHLSMSQRLGLVPASQVERTLVSESYIGAKLVEENDLVLNRLKAHLGVFAYAKQTGLISPDYTVLRPKPDVSVRFFEFILKSAACRAELRTRAKGIVEGFWRLYTDDFYDIRVPVPSLVEQQLIVRFLDWHGGQTAKLIRAKKNIMSLLNEQKQALVHRAVTRGLDATAKLKPSGVTSFGEIPESWSLTRLKILLREKSVKGFPDEPPLAATQTMGVVKKSAYDKRTVLALKDLHLLKLVEVGDFVISLRSFQGGIEYARDRGIISPAYTVLECRYPHFHSYLALVFKSKPFIDVLTQSVTGIREGQNINYEQLSRFALPLPGAEEGNAIVAFVNSATEEIDETLDFISREVALIQEFRTRLICDVVTGKLDVRAASASLPEITELEAMEDLAGGDDLDEVIEDAENEEVAA